MARSGTYGTKQNKVEDCRQWPMHHQGVSGISKSISLFSSPYYIGTEKYLNIYTIYTIYANSFI
jgi:hypothetical protein